MHSQSCCERQAASSQRAAGVTGGAARLGSPVVPRASNKSVQTGRCQGNKNGTGELLSSPERLSVSAGGSLRPPSGLDREGRLCAAAGLRPAGARDAQGLLPRRGAVATWLRLPGDRALCRPQAASATNHSATSAPRRALPPPTAGARGDLRSAGWRGAGVSSARGVYRCVPHGSPRLLDEPCSSSAKRGEGSRHPRPDRHTPGHFRR